MSVLFYLFEFLKVHSISRGPRELEERARSGARKKSNKEKSDEDNLKRESYMLLYLSIDFGADSGFVLL